MRTELFDRRGVPIRELATTVYTLLISWHVKYLMAYVAFVSLLCWLGPLQPQGRFQSWANFTLYLNSTVQQWINRLYSFKMPMRVYCVLFSVFSLDRFFTEKLFCLVTSNTYWTKFYGSAFITLKFYFVKCLLTHLRLKRTQTVHYLFTKQNQLYFILEKGLPTFYIWHNFAHSDKDRKVWLILLYSCPLIQRHYMRWANLVDQQVLCPVI